MPARFDRQLTGATADQAATITVPHRDLDRIGRIKRHYEVTRHGVVRALTRLRGGVLELEARNRELVGELAQRHHESRIRPGQAPGNSQAAQAPRPPAPSISADDLRRLGRDLHDGVQNELVSLMVKLRAAEEDPDTPPALADELGALGTRAEAVLHSVREIAHGIYPSLLTDFGVPDALRGQAARSPMSVRVVGTAPRSDEETEAAVYFSCVEAIQNAAKHAGGGAELTLELHEDRGTLITRIEDNGQGFDPAHTPEGAGLRNIRDRIAAPGGTVKLTSRPGHGTVLTITLPWRPATSDGGMPPSAADQRTSAPRDLVREPSNVT